MIEDLLSETHNIIRESVRRFVQREILPYVEEWEERGEFPRKLYHKAGSAGILGVGYPEELGGSGGDIFCKIVCVEELMRCGSSGVVAGLGSLDISIPPIIEFGSREQKAKFIPPVLKGERISALAVTEPDAGSDVSGIRTRAERRDSYYILNGCKTFITSGARADQLTVAAKTGKERRDISLIIVETDREGVTVSKILKKMGWWPSDTAQIFLDDVKVPLENLIGKEGKGLRYLMSNFQMERLQLSVMAYMIAELALEESIRYIGQRRAFERYLSDFQVLRHKIADMIMLKEVAKTFVYSVAHKISKGKAKNSDVAMAKNFATYVSDMVTDEAVQIHGGYGYMREYLVERLYRDSRILSIGGGTKEIMKEIIAREFLGKERS